jgi:hypothetical protein
MRPAQSAIDRVVALDVLGAHMFADFEFAPTRPLSSKAPNWHRLPGDTCCDPERSAV